MYLKFHLSVYKVSCTVSYILRFIITSRVHGAFHFPLLCLCKQLKLTNFCLESLKKDMIAES